MEVLGRHRIVFNNIGVQLFGDLERDLESALKKGVEERAELEKVVNDQKKLLKEQELLLGVHEKTKGEQVETIAEQKKEIGQLKYELAKATTENEKLGELLAPVVKPDRGRKRAALRTPPRKSIEDKENNPPSPIFNYLTPTPQKLPTLERAVSPPLKSPTKAIILPDLPTDRGVQTEIFYRNEVIQTDPTSTHTHLTEAYYELTTRYDALRNDINKYKSAHQELQEKYLKNKKVWEEWIKMDKARLEQAKKRKRDGSIMLEGGGRKVHGYTTPMNSVTGRTPYTRPPTLSPNKPIFTPDVSHITSKKLGLFASFKSSTENMRSNDLGVDIGTLKGTRDIEIETTTKPLEKPYLEPTSRDDDSLPPLLGPEDTSITHENPGGTQTPNPEDHIGSSTDSESSESRDTDATPTQRLYSPPPVAPPRSDPVFKVPETKKEKLDSKRAQEGGSMVDPVVIKSEPGSSQGFGYHLYEHESLDLDDIGYKPDTPRKRQKVSGFSVEEPTSSASSGRPGWSNGGFTIKRAPGVLETQDQVVIEDTQDEDEGIMWNNREDSEPVFPPLAMNYEGLDGTITDSQLGRPQTPPGEIGIPTIVPGCMKRSAGTIAEDWGGQHTGNEMRSSPPLVGNRFVSRLDNPPSSTTIQRALPAVEESANTKEAPEKPRTRRRVVSGTSIAKITEDGTDGTEDIHSDDLSEKQRKKLKDIPNLSEVLNSPVPKTPSLAHLKRKVKLSRSDPPKKAPRKEPEDPASISEPSKRKNWISPVRHTKGKQKGSRQSKLDISHFRVNPDVNDGRDYAFVETVRNREARKCLPGCVKSCCKELIGFVEAAGLPLPAPRGPRWRSSSPPTSSDVVREWEEETTLDKQFTTRFGKHRDAFARRRSPPGFWDAGFPDTQDLERQHEAAEEMRLQKVEEMRREAEKGGKGRYVYKN